MSKPALYLRDDGTLMLARGEVAIEIALDPGQLLQLGIDCLQVAADMQPALLPSVSAALGAAVIPPHLEGAARRALEFSHVVPSEVGCRKPN